ncbi:MAG: OmpA family protein, partial [Novosphingobium sp.]
ATTALATPAMARDDSWYVELDVGAMKAEDTIFDIGTTADALTLDHNLGLDAGLIVGYDFGAFRLEAEGAYKRHTPDGVNTIVRIPTVAAISLANPGFVGQLPDNGVLGRSSAMSFMVNGLLDFGPDDGLQGFIGGGGGFSTVKHDGISVLGAGPGWLDDSDGGFAWQAIAGVRTPLSDRVDLGLKYRLFNVNNVDMVDSGGRAVSSRWRSHSLMLTLGYNFGEPAAPPPVCNKGPYIVFFDWDKSDITPEAASILDSAVAAYGNCANVPIMLAGYADRSGGNTYNQGLSERRNASVTAYISSRGVPSGAITSQGFGETNNRVPTADGVRELQNRRVEITYGP